MHGRLGKILKKRVGLSLKIVAMQQEKILIHLLQKLKHLSHYQQTLVNSADQYFLLIVVVFPYVVTNHLEL